MRRARERLEQQDVRDGDASNLQKALVSYERSAPLAYLDRIPVRQKQDIVLVAAHQIACAIAEGELIHLTTTRQERYTITYRLKDLEARLDPARFIRLGRGVLANIEEIARVTPLPGGMYTVTLRSGQQLDVSRIQSRRLRQRLLQL
jgi:DNA-binding LytR/AlgR family response regulator